MAYRYFGSFRFNLDTGQLYEGKNLLPLRVKVQAMLTHLLRHPQQAMTKETLSFAIWKRPLNGGNQPAQVIQELRAILRDSPKEPMYIETSQGGYRWIHPLSSKRLTILRKMKPALFNVACLLVLLLIVAWQKPKHSPIAQDSVKSIIILPTLNSLEDPDMEWISIGLTEMLKLGVTKHRGVSLIPQPIILKTRSRIGKVFPCFESLDHVEMTRQIGAQCSLYTNVFEENGVKQFHYKLFGASDLVIDRVVPLSVLLAQFNQVTNHMRSVMGAQTCKAWPNNAKLNEGFAKGLHALATEGTQEALELFQFALREEPDFLELRYQLARIQHERGQVAPQTFLTLQKEARELEHDHLDHKCQIALARLAASRGSLAEARKLLVQVARISFLRKDHYLNAPSINRLKEFNWKFGDEDLLSMELQDQPGVCSLWYPDLFPLMAVGVDPPEKSSALMLLELGLSYHRNDGNRRALAYSLLATARSPGTPPMIRRVLLEEARQIFESLEDQTGCFLVASRSILEGSLHWEHINDHIENAAQSAATLARPYDQADLLFKSALSHFKGYTGQTDMELVEKNLNHAKHLFTKQQDFIETTNCDYALASIALWNNDQEQADALLDKVLSSQTANRAIQVAARPHLMKALYFMKDRNMDDALQKIRILSKTYPVYGRLAYGLHHPFEWVF